MLLSRNYYFYIPFPGGLWFGVIAGDIAGVIAGVVVGVVVVAGVIVGVVVGEEIVFRHKWWLHYSWVSGASLPLPPGKFYCRRIF